ncbi:leucyl aminopeptidase [Paramicrobacterium humi]|nr:leucyl aminopeptidase [Microbacterium humi]
MSVETLDFSTANPLTIDADVVIVGAVSTSDGPRLHAAAGFEWLGDALAGIGASGAPDRLVRVPGNGSAAPVVAIVGIGDAATVEALRYAAGSAVRQLAGTGRVVFAFPLEDDAAAAAVAEGAALAGYAFSAEKGVSSVPEPVRSVTVAVPSAPAGDVAERAQVVAEAVHLVRDLGNTSASLLYPEEMANRARAAVEGLPVTTTVWDENALERDGFGGILGVGRGSVRAPRLVKLEYSPEGATRHISLVGKGITFDTGGLSLKPAGSMVGMKYDMLGAATVLAAVVGAARLGVPTRLTAWLCIAENMPSGSATRPGDVLTMHGGRTVEVLNTDAEGRLVMADGLVAASAEQPDLILDVATLTGAATIALGKRYTGVMGNDETADTVVSLADAQGEPFWRMPLAPELRAVLDSDVADIANAKIGHREGGMLIAGHFLNEFIGTRPDSAESIPWVHLDIAGPGDNGEAGYGFTGKGATGVAVRTLLSLAEQYGRA